MKIECKNKISNIQISRFGGTINWSSDISEKLGGITLKKYNKVLNNKSQPAFDELPLWANWLNVPMEELFDMSRTIVKLNHRFIKAK